MNFNDYARKTLVPLTKTGLDNWTIEDAMKGVSIMGGTGSGKTTASGKILAMKYLKEGWGGVVLCAKTDEADLWKDYCEQTGRGDDYLRFSNHSEYVFNALDYEMKRKGKGAGDTQNLTNIFMNIYRMGNRIAQEGDTKEERFWDTALKRCLNRSIELIKLSGEDLSYQNMVKILSSSAQLNTDKAGEAAELVSDGKKDINAYNNNQDYCLYCLLKAYQALRAANYDPERQAINDTVTEYFIYSLNGMGNRTRSIVLESFMGLAEPFLSGVLRRHFSGKTNLYPEQAYGHNPNDREDVRNRVIVIDFPIKEYLDAGIMAQCVFKLMFQQCIERRDVEQHPTPVFLWCDEAQYFVNPYDQIFLTTARSSRTATVYLSQNISNYFAVMGSGNDAKARVDSLMGNLSTKIFHANSDSETNEYASRLIGHNLQNVMGASVNSEAYFQLPTNIGQSISSQFLPQVPPRLFTTLRTGGANNDFKVDSFIVVNGRKWSDGMNFLFTTFPQTFQTQKLSQWITQQNT